MPLGSFKALALYGQTMLIVQLVTMLTPQLVNGEHGLFGGHESEDIRTFFLSRVCS